MVGEGAVKRALAMVALLAGCATPSACPPADLASVEGDPAYAFLASDYASSAVGLLDEDGAVLREAWLDSGTVPPNLVAAISGDAVLASSSLAPCVITVIDRYHDALTFLDACTGGDPVLGQLDVGPSFYANPQDVIALDATRALVSRANPNAGPEASELERGNDLLVVDWRAGEVLSRVDLSGLDHDGDERIYARPYAMARLQHGGADVVLAGLARLSRDWFVAGPGAVAVVDIATLVPRALPLEGLTNCREVDPVPGSPELAVVTCNGATFGTTDDRRAGAGVALLALSADGEVRVRGLWRAADHIEAPVFNTWSVPLSADRVLTIAMGDVRVNADRAGILSFERDSAEVSLLMEAGEAFVLGAGAFHDGRLLLPDAYENVIRRFVIDEGVRELDPISTSACRGLPPREVRRITP